MCESQASTTDQDDLVSRGVCTWFKLSTPMACVVTATAD